MEIICYSCGRGEAPENSLEGIRHCQSINAEWRIEMDIQMTADNKLVLFHDQDTLRTTGVRSLVSQLTLDELKQLNIGRNFRIDGQFPYRESPVRVVELSDVFREFPAAKLLLDLHTKNPMVIQPFIDLIEREFKHGDFVIASKEDAIVDKLRKERPKWTYGVPAKEAKKMLYSSFIYLDGLFPIQSDVLMLPQRYGGINVLSKRVVAHAHKRNKKLWAWMYESKDLDPTKFKAVESVKELDKLRTLGVSGVFTEYPEILSREMG